MNNSNPQPLSLSSMNPNQQKRYLSREFKKRGLSLQPAALTALMNVLRREEEVYFHNYKKKDKKNMKQLHKNEDNNNDILQILLNEIKQRMMNGNGNGNGNAYHDRQQQLQQNQSNNTYSHNPRDSTYNSGSNIGGEGGGGGTPVMYNSSIVTPEILQNVVADLSRDGNDVLDEALQLLNAWKMKRLDYNIMKKRWSLVDEYQEEIEEGNSSASDESAKKKRSGRSVFGKPCDKVNMLLQRYYLIQQRILRHEMFQNKLSINYSSPTSNILQMDQHKLTPIEGLLGTTDTKTILGIIIQMDQPNQYYLEDPSGYVPLDLSHIHQPSTDGFITEYSIVLIEGQMAEDGETLLVETIGHPMYESRNDAIGNIGLGNSNIFESVPNLNELTRLENEELEHGPDGMFVILSDVHLDDVNVLEKLEVMFGGYCNSLGSDDNEAEGDGDDDGDDDDLNRRNGTYYKKNINDNNEDEDDDAPLPVFILMGDFASTYPSSTHGISTATNSSITNNTSSYKQFVTNLFDELANVITKFPKLAKEGRFVLIPSNNDVGIGNILPRPPLPHYFLKGLKSKVKHVHLASNPCRLRYFSKEIVLGRIDVLSKLRRNCILPPREKDDFLGITQDSQSGNDDMDRLIQHSIKTILDQSHLCPVPLQTTPIYWQYDHALRLYPSPDILVLSESTIKQYSEKYEDVEVMNPGPFYVDNKFLVIRPCDVRSTSRGEEVFVDVEFSHV